MILDAGATRAARRALKLCEERTHVSCVDPNECERALRVLDRQLVEGARFDARRDFVLASSREPQSHHSTAALMRGVADMTVSAPWRDSLWRSVWITSALARLAERGIPADAVLRTGVAPALRERIAFEAASAWYANRRGSLQIDDIEPRIRAWVEVLDGAIRSYEENPEALALTEVFLLARSGLFAEVLQRWIERTAVAHVIDWRVTDPLRVELLPRDVVVAGGREATWWLFDRFTLTYLSDWRPSSLLWELGYCRDPEGVAERVQVSGSVLAERSVNQGNLLDTVTGRHARAQSSASHVGGIQEDMYDQILLLARGGEVQRARDLAHLASQENPDAVHFLNAYAFLTIPFDPLAARRLFDDADLRRVPQGIRLANAITVSIALGELSDAVRDLRASAANDNESAWLWSPGRIGSGEWVIEHYSLDDWFAEASELLVEPRS